MVASGAGMAMRASATLDRPLDPLTGYGGNRALFHHQLVSIEVARDVAGDGFDVTQVCLPIFPLRCAHANEENGSGTNRFADFVRKCEFPTLQVLT